MSVTSTGNKRQWRENVNRPIMMMMRGRDKHEGMSELVELVQFDSESVLLAEMRIESRRQRWRRQGLDDDDDDDDLFAAFLFSRLAGATNDREREGILKELVQR